MLSSGVSQINLANQQTMFVWPSYGQSRIVHIKRLDSDETESRFQVDAMKAAKADEDKNIEPGYRKEGADRVAKRELSAMRGRIIDLLA